MRKENMTYYFSVEGETEKWYLDWLQNCINECDEAKYKVKLDSKIEKDPLVRAKSMTILGKTEITHVFDRESEDELHTKQFMITLNRMKEAEKLGKNIKYKLGYSNFTFELWIILHKKDLKGPLTDKKQYLKYINEIFDEDFKSLDEYKEEKNFKRVVEQITLEDIINAIKRAEKIRDHNKEYNKQIKYGKYIYYKENPDLEINESIEKILNDCEIL
mgnify:CR=1 FL=1